MAGSLFYVGECRWFTDRAPLWRTFLRTGEWFETVGARLTAMDVDAFISRSPDWLFIRGHELSWSNTSWSKPDVHDPILHYRNIKTGRWTCSGLRGDDLQKYQSAGIQTDHECFTYDEAFGKKSSSAWKVILREGSAAKLFCACSIDQRLPGQLMFCRQMINIPMTWSKDISTSSWPKAVTKDGYDVNSRCFKIACVNLRKHTI